MMAIHYTKGEERTNYISHAGGILLGIVVGTLLLIYCYRHENLWMQWGVWLYMFGMLGSYIASPTPNELTIDSTKLYPSVMLLIVTPSTAQFVVISGRYTPRLW